MSKNPLLQVRGVSRRFQSNHGETLALQATDLDVAENDFITILGPSGCGKSTLLRIVAGLDVQSSGEVLLEFAELKAELTESVRAEVLAAQAAMA